MGLREATYIIKVCEQPVAMIYSGQFAPSSGLDAVLENTRLLGSGRFAHIKVTDAVRKELLSRAEALPPEPPKLHELLEREALFIQGLAEDKCHEIRLELHQVFLDALRGDSSYDTEVRLEQIERNVASHLQRVITFCGCEYAVFFASVQEEDTVLAPIAAVGVPSEVEARLPHFNWRKAGLPVDGLNVNTWNLIEKHQAIRKHGIRGGNSEYFENATVTIPIDLSNGYRGILVLGPMAARVNLGNEKRFLVEITTAVGTFALNQLGIRSLFRERRRWENTAILLTHQLRTALTPITSTIGRAKYHLHARGSHSDFGRCTDYLTRAEDLALYLSEVARETLAGHVIQVEFDDLEFEYYPLSVLVGNCAEGFLDEAESQGLKLDVSEEVEFLPCADVDVARLTIALANLFENAVKYTFPGKTIRVGSRLAALTKADQMSAVIEIDSLGEEIVPEVRERIFELGTRGLTKAKMGQIPGTGLGLWETRAVVEAHGGAISVECTPTGIRTPRGRGYRVVFSVRIPLRHRDS
jgi:signal transduction histidine kinase